MVSPLLAPSGLGASRTGALGVAASLASAFIPNMKVWSLQNLDDGETIMGQFEAENVSRQITPNWSKFASLNRPHPIYQFVNGDSDNLSFVGRLFKNSILDDGPQIKLKKIQSWARMSETDNLRRPPILQFTVGDGHISESCIITGFNTQHARPGFLGDMRDVSFTVSLEVFHTFSLDDEKQTDTRYARAKDRDYYEMLALKEYGNPLTGDIIRKDHPELQRLKTGDIVRLPSIEGVRNKQVTQRSTALKTSFGKRDTPQRQLRIRYLELRSSDYVTHVLQPATAPG